MQPNSIYDELMNIWKFIRERGERCETERDRETQGGGGGGGGGRGEGEGIPLVWRSEDSFKNFVLFF